MPTLTPLRRCPLRAIIAPLRWTGLVLGVLSAAMMAVSFVRFDAAEYRTGDVAPPNASRADYLFTLHTRSFFQGYGAISISWWDFESRGVREEDLRPWQTMIGFEHERLRPGDINRRKWFSIDGWDGWRFAGLGFERFTAGSSRVTAIHVPHWLLIAAFASPWFLHARHSRTRRRVRAGLCPRCGYDRAGHSAAQACPECGAASMADGVLDAH